MPISRIVPARRGNPAALALELTAAALVIAGLLLANWLWPADPIDYETVQPVAAAPALTVGGLAWLAAAVCWAGAVVARAVDRAGRRSG